MKEKKLNIGSGYIYLEGFINLDIDVRVEPHVCGSILDLPFPDETFDFVRAHHVIEHVVETEAAMLEIWRVMKYDAVVSIEVPLYPGRMAVAPWEHRSIFTPDTFSMILNPRDYQPKACPYDLNCKFDKVKEDGPPLCITKWKNDFLSEELDMCQGDITGNILLKKTNLQYWKDKKIHKLLESQVYGCFFCGHRLVKIAFDKKECPGCKEIYTWKDPNS